MIEFNNVRFSYNQDLVINDLSLQINKGDYVAITGGNGSGKSTLIKLMVGLLKPDTGSLTVLSDKVAYVPQNGLESITFPVTVEELLSFRLPKNKFNKQNVNVALKTVGLLDLKKRLIKDLSGGQRQRVLIARELIINPEIMILDEPTNGLDQDSIASLYKLLSQLHKEGLTVVLVTHHIESHHAKGMRVLKLDHQSLQEIDYV